MIFGCAFFFGMLFRTVISFSLDPNYYHPIRTSAANDASAQISTATNGTLAQNSTKAITPIIHPENFITGFDLEDKTKT
jgi:hypothetical protein